MEKKKLKIVKQKLERGESSLELLEQSFHLLRTQAFSALPVYFLGTMPFAVALMYFINDMSSDFPTPSIMASSAFSLTALYFVKNFFQSIYCRKLLQEMHAGQLEPMTIYHAIRLFILQGIIQPIGWLVHCIGAVIIAPAAIGSAFFTSFFAIASLSNDPLKVLLGKSWRAAIHRHKQNHLSLAIIFVMTLVVSLNIGILIFIVPGFLNMFLGIETQFSQISGADFFMSTIGNSTFWSIVLVGTYLVIDPFIKALYTVRTFYAASVFTGADIMADVATIRKKGAVLTLLVLITLSPFCDASDSLTKSQTLPAAQKVEEINNAISETLTNREYRWRSLHEPIEVEEEASFLAEYLQSFFNTIGDILEWILDVMEKFFERENPKQKKSEGFGNFLQEYLDTIVYVLCGIVALVIGWYIYRGWKNKKTVRYQPDHIENVTIDLDDENLTADALEVDEWMKLADELIVKGELRLAMRALFLSAISMLSKRNLLSIAKFKTNRDYLSELKRRYHYNSDALRAFDTNLNIFERGWYGDYPVDITMINDFKLQNEIILKFED